MSVRPGVFLDRDGTLIEDPGYLARPEQVRLLPGAAAAVASLNAAGVPVVVVTNQSGIARGLFDEAAYQATAARLEALLAREHARLDAQYHCPHHPEFTGPCECRKPGTLLYREAAARFALDLRRSWWIGDHFRDVEPALAMGGRGVLVRRDAGPGEVTPPDSERFPVVPDLAAAVRHVLADCTRA